MSGDGESLERQVLTVPETARILGISRSTCYDAVKKGQLPVVVVGRRYLIPRVALERLLMEAAPKGVVPQAP